MLLLLVRFPAKRILLKCIYKSPFTTNTFKIISNNNRYENKGVKLHTEKCLFTNS